MEYAGFWRQVASGSLDMVFAGFTFMIIYIFFYAFVGGISDYQSQENALSILTAAFKVLSVAYYFLYRTLMIASPHMASYGMRMVNIIATDLDGNRLTFARTCAREALSYLSMLFFWIGYLIIPFTERKQGFHDIATNSLVLKQIYD